MAPAIGAQGAIGARKVEEVVTLRRLVLGTLLAAFRGPVAPDWARDLVTEGLAGHLLFGSNVVDHLQLTALCASLRSARPDVLIAIDEEGGDVTRLGHRDGSPYPGNAALGAIDDPPLTRTIYRAIGADLATVGINLNLAPTVDVNTVSDNPVIGTRSFGADPTLVARHAAAAVTGLQEVGVAACAKHFPGHGATTVDSHLELPTIDAPLSVLRERDLPPFAAAVGAGALAIMTAHIRVPSLTGSLPATFSPAVLDLLRSAPDLGGPSPSTDGLRSGFHGVVITDALEMLGATRAAGGVAPGAVLALTAGADLLCIGADVTSELVEEIVAAVIEAIDDGRLPLARVEEAATRVRTLAAWTRDQRSSREGSAVVGSPAGAASGSASAAGVRVGAAERDADAGPGVSEWSDVFAELGLRAARRAVSVDGTLPDLSNALVVQLESTSTIAEGRVPWGILPHLDAEHGTTSIRVAALSASPSTLVEAAAGRPIVISGRNLHRLRGAAALVETLADTATVVVVEMGWPSTWRPARACAFVTTWGASRANGRAAAEALGIAA
jgi:beta-N-acetylhexosaminidase